MITRTLKRLRLLLPLRRQPSLLALHIVQFTQTRSEFERAAAGDRTGGELRAATPNTLSLNTRPKSAPKSWRGRSLKLTR